MRTPRYAVPRLKEACATVYSGVYYPRRFPKKGHIVKRRSDKLWNVQQVKQKDRFPAQQEKRECWCRSPCWRQ